MLKLITIGVLSTSIAAPTAFGTLDDASNIRALPGISRAIEQTPVLPKAPGAPFSVELNLDGAVHRVSLHPHTLRSPDFTLLMPDANGVLQSVPAPAPRTYRGTVDGFPMSHVSASLLETGLHGYIELHPDVPALTVAPLAELGLPGAPGAHVTYRNMDAERTPWTCGNQAVNVEEEVDGASAFGTGLKTCEIAFDIDAVYVGLTGSAGAALADVENVFNTTDFVYQRDVDITYEVTFAVIRVGSDPYTTSVADALLCEVRDVWNSTPENAIPRDIVQLYTGRSIVGSTIGIAFNGVICNVVAGSGCGGVAQNIAYSLVQSRFTTNFDQRVSLSAHELGHNWNAAHCNGAAECNIMCDSVDACDGTTGANLKFAPISQNTIANFRNSRPCLDDLPLPLSPPFFDDVPTTTIDETKWIWRQNVAAIASPIAGEPSDPNVLRLFSQGAGDFRDGEIRSNFIDLSGQSDFVVSFFVNHTSVEAGEQLITDFLNDQGSWSQLNLYSAPGIDLPFFFEFELPLPSNAYHENFRIRFRQVADQVNDQFVVDDVFVGDPDPGVPCPEDLDGSGDVGFTDLLAVLSAWGPCDGCPEDLDGSGDVGFTDLLQVLSAWGPCE